MSLLAAALGITDLSTPVVGEKEDLDFKLGPDGGKMVLKVKPDGSIEAPEYLNGAELRKAANLCLKLDPGAFAALAALSEIARLRKQVESLKEEVDVLRKGRKS